MALVAAGAILAVLWLGPLPAMSRTAFSAHMILHLALVVVVAPLLAIGLRPWLRGAFGFADALSWALLAATFEMVVVWGWHLPGVHAAAALDDSWFVAQQISFLAAGLCVWASVLTVNTRASAGAGAIAATVTFMHMTMFGLLITLSPRLLYDPAFCRGALGVTGLEDQRLGGMLMVVFGGLPYAAGAAWCVYRLLDRTRDMAPSDDRAG